MKLIAPLSAILVALALSSSAHASVTVGSLPPSTTTGACAFCGAFQVSDTGPNLYTSPVRGVITSFSVRSGTVLTAADNYRLWLGTPAAAPNWTLAGASDFMHWPGTTAAFTDKKITWNTRVSIMQGEHIGLEVHDAGGNTSYFYNTASATDAIFGPSTFGYDVGSTSTSGTTFTSTRMNVIATVEPDSDFDGYGDETQDGCPTDRSDHGACTAPSISDFKFSLDKFAVEKTGSVLSQTLTAQGTTVIITLSKAARVKFEMKLKSTGRKVGKLCKKQTAKNRKRKKCTRYPRTFTFTRDLPQGTSNLGFSGRIKVGSKTASLPAGKYVATASPFSVASNLAGPAATAKFTVVPPPKKR